MGSILTPPTGSPAHFPFGKVVNPVQAAAAADVLPVADAVVFVTRAGVDAMTLALPIAGSYPAGVPLSLGDPRDDGKKLLVVSTTAFAHTITTPANGINKTLHIATFGAAVGNWVLLIAFQGTWYMVGQLGVTLS
jgi:hypothetical protein